MNRFGRLALARLAARLGWSPSKIVREVVASVQELQVTCKAAIEKICPRRWTQSWRMLPQEYCRFRSNSPVPWRRYQKVPADFAAGQLLRLA